MTAYASTPCSSAGADWITIDDVRQPRHIVHRGPHVVDRETLIEHRVTRWALTRDRRVNLRWADTLSSAENIACDEFAETERRLHQQPGTHRSGRRG